jgi:HEAT repeat protein
MNRHQARSGLDPTGWFRPSVLPFLCFLCAGAGFAQSGTAAATGPNSGTTPVVSETVEWKETLEYGIDSEIISLLERLSSGKDLRLAREVLGVFSVTRNVAVREAALKYFVETGYREAVDDVLAVLDRYDEESVQVLLSAFRYLSALKPDGLADRALPLIDHENRGVASVAIKAIGETGSERHLEELLEKLDDEEYENERKSDIILALGDLGAEGAVDRLVSILEDTDSEPIWRRYACISLGKIGRADTLETLIGVYAEADTLLRSYAVSGVALYRDDRVIPFLIDALKDSYVRVRISAAQGLAERKVTEAVPILVYKAKKDPEAAVRTEAMTALAKIGGYEAVEYLTSVVRDEKTTLANREKAIVLLVEHRIEAALEVLEETLAKEWEKKDSKLVEIIGRELSKKEAPGLERLLERLLDHPSYVVQIYGIRGIERNGLVRFRNRIEELSEGERTHTAVKKAALAALERL